MHRSQQALSCNVLEGESTQLPEQFEVDKSHAIITMKTMTLYAVLDKGLAAYKTVQDHPNILHLFAAYEDADNVYLLVPLCKGGSLFATNSHVKPSLDSAIAARYTSQVASALQHCRSQGVIHRNISGESIWLTDSTNNADAMLAGFEFSQSSILDPRQRLSACLGQVCYMAPEVVKKNYFFAADSYSFGVVLYCLLTGHLPFEGYSDEEVKAKIVAEECQPDWSQIHDLGALELVQLLMRKTPKSRLTPSEILDHRWVKGLAGTMLAPNASPAAAGPSSAAAAARHELPSGRSCSLTRGDTVSVGGTLSSRSKSAPHTQRHHDGASIKGNSTTASKVQAAKVVALPRRSARRADMIKNAEQEADKDAALALLDLVSGKPGENLPPVGQAFPSAVSPGGQPPESRDEESKKTSPHVRGVTPPRHRHSPPHGNQQTATHSRDSSKADQALLLLPPTGSDLDGEAATASGQAATHTVANTAVINEVPRQTVQVAEKVSLISRLPKLLQDSSAPTGDRQLDLARSVVDTFSDFTAAKIHQRNHELAKGSQKESGLDMYPADFHPCKNKQERDAYVAAAAREAQESALACKPAMMDAMNRSMKQKDSQAASTGGKEQTCHVPGKTVPHQPTSGRAQPHKQSIPKHSVKAYPAAEGDLAKASKETTTSLYKAQILARAKALQENI